jgi:hypothetical protein
VRRELPDDRHLFEEVGNQVIVGLAGYARAGKSEAAKGLEAVGWEVHAYADKLREFLYTLNPIIEQSNMAFVTVKGYVLQRPVQLRDIIDKYGWDGYKGSMYSGEIRRLIQTLGTDCGRNLIGENVWVDSTFKYYLPEDQWVIADVRFPNELNAIRERGGLVIRITKPDVGPLNNHPSETSLDEYDLPVLVNDGSINQLHDKIRKLTYSLYGF